MEAMAQSGRVISWEVFTHNGASYTCGHRLDDSLVCWNEDQSVYLDPTPASVEAFATADADTACWLLPDHTAACWVHVTTWWGKMSMPEGEFRSISLGETVYGVFGCGIRTDGSLSCWGDAELDWGHLDPPPGEYKAVSTGFGRGCAIRVDDTLVCWGNHNIGTAPEGTFVTSTEAGSCTAGSTPTARWSAGAATVPAWTWLNFWKGPIGRWRWGASHWPTCAVCAWMVRCVAREIT